ncbi:hypothetical protein AALO_G00293790 [Alosa alosa]|uniref:Uncharacterized protein n=1 Tax=Alosa alosa TaxID=278164 RepID=A0AAV6FHV6_9TELE|nr:hypothetical protein AALO_G00293790 [Alosa alosa]
MRNEVIPSPALHPTSTIILQTTRHLDPGMQATEEGDLIKQAREKEREYSHEKNKFPRTQFKGVIH